MAVRQALSLSPVARLLPRVSDGYHENACRVLAVHDEIGEACQSHALCAVKMVGPSVGPLGNSIKRRLELLREPHGHAWVALCVPRGGIFGLCEGGREEIKAFRGGRSQPNECDAVPPARGSA